MIQQDNSYLYSLVFLSGIFACCIVVSVLLGSSLLLIWGFTVSAGAFVIPLIFIALEHTTVINLVLLSRFNGIVYLLLVFL